MGGGGGGGGGKGAAVHDNIDSKYHNAAANTANGISVGITVFILAEGQFSSIVTLLLKYQKDYHPVLRGNGQS